MPSNAIYTHYSSPVVNEIKEWPEWPSRSYLTYEEEGLPLQESHKTTSVERLEILHLVLWPVSFAWMVIELLPLEPNHSEPFFHIFPMPEDYK